MAFSESQKQVLWSHPTSVVYEKKLDTALRDSSIRLMKREIENEIPSNYKFDLKLLTRYRNPKDILHMKTDNTCYAVILDHILSESRDKVFMSHNDTRLLSKCFSLGKKNLSFQHNYSTQSNDLPSASEATQSLQEKLSNFQPTVLIANLMHASKEFRNVIDKTALTKRRLDNSLDDSQKIEELSKSNSAYVRTLETKLTWSIHHVIIQTPDYEVYIMPIQYLLLIHNKLSDLLSVLMLAYYQSGICHSDDAYDTTVNFVSEMTRLCLKYNNNFSDISGSIEGMAIGETLNETEEWENTDLIMNIHNDLLDSCGFNYLNSRLRQILLSAKIPLRNELACCSKLLGHPFVDMEGGAKKLHKRTTTSKELTYESVSWVVNKAKETFVRNYIARHNKWPPVEIKRDTTIATRDPLLNAMLRNQDPYLPSIRAKYGEISNADWNRVELNQVMEFQQLENIIPFLKDKSISVLRSQAVQAYLRESKDRCYKWEDTRLLLYYLLNPLKKLDHQSFLTKYAESETLESLADYLIIRLVPKEKEHKIKFRGFGVKTYLDRLRNLAQEKNMATFLDMYCDEQAMTLGEIDISKRLYALRTILKAYRGYKVLYVNFDSSGWNNCFRDETVNPVIRETVSKIMNSTVMHRIHEGYEQSLFIVPDGETTYYWEGQQGGIDGLNQYAWVWVYINQIKYAVKDLPVRYHMFCKGDDMRLAILIHPKNLEAHDMKYYHTLIVEQVEKAAKEFGHEIKIQESYGSEKYFTFSKAASIGTIELPQGFRKIQKVYGANNAMISVLDEYVSSSFSNAHSACKSMTNTYGAYMVALIWSYWQVLQCPCYKELTDDQLVALMLIPNMLGGFPIIYLHNMRVRAESDLLSPFIHMMQFAYKNYPSLFRVLVRSMYCQIDRTKGMTRLYRDPYSLKIRTPQLPVAKLRSYILPILEKKVKNKDIKDLIKASKSNLSKMILLCMASATPQDAKIMSTIYSATPEGILGELLRKFESGRSVLDLLLLRGDHKSCDYKLKQVLLVEDYLQTWRSKMVKSELNEGYKRILPIDFDVRCPAEIAQYLRNSTWNTDIQGISMPPLAHQVRLCRPVDASFDKHAENNHFLYTYDVPTISLQQDIEPHWCVSDKEPFLGYTTRTGNITPRASFHEKDPLIVKVKNLLDLITWVNRSRVDEKGNIIVGNLLTLIKAILSLYTEFTPDDLAPFQASRRSGTIQHHGRAPRFRESIVPNILSNMYQNVTGKSNSHVTLVRSDCNYTVNFLHIMCECIHQIHIELETCNTLTPPRLIWGVTNNCTFCTKPIVETPVIIDTTLLPQEQRGVLNACRLEHVSKRMIIQSYNDFNQTEYKNISDENNPNPDLATTAVVAEFVHHLFRTHKTVQTRFTQAALPNQARATLVNLTHKTMSRIVGYTELKKIEIQEFMIALAPPVYEFIMTRVPSSSQSGILVELQKIQSYELPWYNILCHIKDVRKLGEIIVYCQNATKIPAPPSYEDPAASSPYIGFCIFKLVSEGKIKLRVAIRSYMDRVQSIQEYNFMINPYRSRLINDYFVKVTKSWKPGSQMQDVRNKLCTRAIYIASMDINEEDLADDLAQNPTGNEFIEVDLSTYIDVDVDNIILVLDDESDPRNRIISHLVQNYPSWPWEECIDTIRNGDIDNILIRQIVSFAKEYKVMIGFCDIASSISVLRSGINTGLMYEQFQKDHQEFSDNDSSYDSDSSTYMALPEYVEEIKCNYSHKKLPKNVLAMRCVQGPTRHDGYPRYDPPNFTNDKIIYDECHYYRLYGNKTTSQSKLDYVFSVTGISKTLPHNRNYIITADGYGGFVEYISAITYGSHFVFNTLAPDAGVNYFPYSATTFLRDNVHTVDATYVDRGIDDLSTEECTKNLCDYDFPVSGVTCDADVKWDNPIEASQILKNVVRIYLTTGSHDSFLICKTNIGLGEVNANMMSILRMYCRNVFLVRCPNSNVGGEVYLVAQCIDRICTNFKWDDYHCNIDELRIYAEFSDKIYNDYLVALGKNEFQVTLPLIRSMRVHMNSLIPAVNSKYYSRIGIVLRLEELVNEHDTEYDVIKTIRARLDNHFKDLNDIAHRPERHMMSGLALDQLTITHIRIACMRVLTCCGLRWFLSICHKCNTINKQSIRIEFNKSCQELPTRARLFPVSPKWFKSSFIIDNVKMLSPYRCFMNGIKLGQMTHGYLRHTRLRMRPPTEDISSLFYDS